MLTNSWLVLSFGVQFQPVQAKKNHLRPREILRVALQGSVRCGDGLDDGFGCWKLSGFPIRHFWQPSHFRHSSYARYRRYKRAPQHKQNPRARRFSCPVGWGG